MRDEGLPAPHSSWQEGARNLGLGLGSQRLQGSRSPAPTQPGLQRALLTLDLLVDHQGKVVRLQDVRELAQWVRQADLKEKWWLVPTGAAQLGVNLARA